MAVLFEIAIMMTNLGMKKTQKLYKSCTKKTKIAPAGCRRSLEEMQRHVSFLDSQELVLPWSIYKCNIAQKLPLGRKKIG